MHMAMAVHLPVGQARAGLQFGAVGLNQALPCTSKGRHRRPVCTFLQRGEYDQSAHRRKGHEFKQADLRSRCRIGPLQASAFLLGHRSFSQNSRQQSRLGVHSDIHRAQPSAEGNRISREASGTEHGRVAAQSRGSSDGSQELDLPAVEEPELRQYFLERLGLRAREGDKDGAEEAFMEMRLLGLDPGPRAHHALIVAFARAGNTEGAMQKLQRELALGQVPHLETFQAVIAALASQGAASRAEDVMAWVEKTGHDSCMPWMLLVEGLLDSGFLEEANQMFFKGAEGGLPASQALFDRMIQENAEAGPEHFEKAYKCLSYMEQFQLPSRTRHWNHLLQAHARQAQTSSEARQCAVFLFERLGEGPPRMWPNADSYHILAEALIRNNYPSSLNDALETLGEMLNDSRMPQPHVKTLALFVEAFVMHQRTGEALRYLRAFLYLSPPNSLHMLANDTLSGSDPLSLLIRLLACEGRIDTLLWLLEQMSAQRLQLRPRALMLQKVGYKPLHRSLVSAWLEPVNKEADLGFKRDHIREWQDRIAQEDPRVRLPSTTAAMHDGLAALEDSPFDYGEMAEEAEAAAKVHYQDSLLGRPFWSLSSVERASAVTNPDQTGWHSMPWPKQRSWQAWLRHLQIERQWKLLNDLLRNGREMMGQEGNPQWLLRIMKRLRNDVQGEVHGARVRKPKAASKMLVNELRDELKGWGLSAEGTRPMLYQRVQRARRQARIRGEELWMPSTEEEEAEALLWDFDSLKAATKVEGEEAGWYEPETEAEAWLAYLRSVLPEERQQYRRRRTSARDKANQKQRSEAELEIDAMLKGFSEETVDDLRKSFEMTPEQRAEQAEGPEWWAFQYWGIGDALGWTWEEEEKQFKETGPVEVYDTAKELDMARRLLFKVEDMGAVPTREDYCFLVRSALKVRNQFAVVELLERAFSKYGYTYGELLYQEAIELCVEKEDISNASRVIVQMHDKAGLTIEDKLLQAVIDLQGQDNGSQLRSQEPAGT